MIVSRRFAPVLAIAALPVSIGCQANTPVGLETPEELGTSSAAFTEGGPTATPTSYTPTSYTPTSYTPTNEAGGTRYPVDLVCPAVYEFAPAWDANGVCVVKTRYAESDAMDTVPAYRQCDKTRKGLMISLEDYTFNRNRPGPIVYSATCVKYHRVFYVTDRGIGQCPIDYTLQVVPSGCYQPPTYTLESRSSLSTTQGSLDEARDWFHARCKAKDEDAGSDTISDGACVKCRITRVVTVPVAASRCAGLPKPTEAAAETGL